MNLKQINKELRNNAKYMVTLIGDGDLLNKLFTDLFFEQYGSQKPDASDPRFYGHNAATYGIRNRFYDSSKTYALSCSLVMKDTLDSYINEIVKTYEKKTSKKPIIEKRIESKVQLLP